MKRHKLTKEEREIEREIDQYVPASSAAKRRLKRAVDKARKEHAISLRMREQDLWQIKQMAAEEGLPYQTFISSILHKYIGRRLVDVNSAKQMKQLLKMK